MRHGVRTKRFRSGIDANKMLVRKLVKNFFAHGHLTTTETKAKFARPFIEVLSGHIVKNTNASRNVLERKLGDKKLVLKLVSELGPKLKVKSSGFVSLIKLQIRESDGTKMMKLTWSFPMIVEPKPVVVEEPKKIVKKVAKKQ